MGGARVRGDAPADAGLAGRADLGCLHAPVPDGAGVRRVPAVRGREGVGGARLQPSGGQPPPRRGRHGRRGAARPRCAARVAGNRRVHRSSCTRVRVRGGRRGRRHEHRAGAVAASGPAADDEGAAARGRRARTLGRGVGVESAPHGSRCPRVHRSRPVVRYVLVPCRLSLGRRAVAHQAAVDVRGLGPARPGAVGDGAPRARGAGARAAGSDGMARRPGRARSESRRSSSTRGWSSCVRR